MPGFEPSDRRDMDAIKKGMIMKVTVDRFEGESRSSRFDLKRILVNCCLV